MFAILYHILLVELEDEELDVHNYFGSSLWKGIPSLLYFRRLESCFSLTLIYFYRPLLVWTYSLGEVDDSAIPTTDSYFLFSAFSLVVIIIMMNILIAIVSDSCTPSHISTV
jgi:hypothetical protein